MHSLPREVDDRMAIADDTVKMARDKQKSAAYAIMNGAAMSRWALW